MKKVNQILIGLVGLLIGSCTSNTIQEIQPPIPVGTPITYTTYIKPIFDAKCVGCHGGGSQYPNLETFTQVKDGCVNGNVFCRIRLDNLSCGGVMPQSGKMSQQTIDLIKLWKTQGYLN